MYSDIEFFENYLCSLSPKHLSIIMYICEQAAKNGGFCKETYEQISKALNCSTRAIAKIVARTQRYKYIKVRRLGPNASKIFVRPEIIEKLDSVKNSFWYKLLNNKNLTN